MSKNDKPRISVNKLAEYLYAKPARRRNILTELKNPQPFIVSRYADARTAITDYLNSGDKSIIENALKQLNQKETNSTFQVSDKKLSFEALKKVKVSAMLNTIIDMESTSISENTLVEINGVDISVNPDLIIRHQKGQKNIIGGLKINIGKTPMKNEAQQIVALLLEDFLQNKKSDDEIISHTICYSFDVFEDKLVPGSQSKKRRKDDVLAACSEILVLWPTI
jgi:hypothetical protein